MKKLIVLTGPTGVGKTELSLKIAEHFGCDIISIDSRQLYKDLEIGTAAPTRAQHARVVHHFVGILDVHDYYSVSDYENEAIAKIEALHHVNDVVLATGGSMMYVDALCYGVDTMPAITPELRYSLYKQYEEEGLESILAQLKLSDPVHYHRVDHKNHKRVIHALEVCLQTGRPYSSFLTGRKKKRSFDIIRIGLERERNDLNERINNRVDEMIVSGLLQEAEQFYPQRSLNALNTVGYKELFKYFDGEWTLDLAIEKIKKNTRTYAKQQMRWLKKDNATLWFNLTHIDEEEIIWQIIKEVTKQ